MKCLFLVLKTSCKFSYCEKNKNKKKNVSVKLKSYDFQTNRSHTIELDEINVSRSCMGLLCDGFNHRVSCNLILHRLLLNKNSALLYIK